MQRCILQAWFLCFPALFCIMQVRNQKGKPFMSKKRQPAKRSASRKGRASASASSFILPIVVGILVVTIIVFAIITVENRQAVAAVPTSTLSVPVVTTQPMATTEIPFPNVQRISLKDTQAQLAKGQAVLIDVRTKESFDQSHAVGALSIPETDLAAHINELPRDKLLILYCT
jgi:hypothetical protein